MDPTAATLLRSASRAFYPPEHILILDAILLHSALSDDDLAHLMGQQRKALRKLSSKLVHDGVVTVTSRQEIKEGHTRPINKDYYWVDTHRAIDVVKYRIKSMFKEVERRYGQKVEEKKEFRCGTCKSEYTQMEVLDSVGPYGFICKLCSSELEPLVDDSTAGQAGHEVQSRMNAQLGTFESLMQKIDNTEIAENTFDRALANHLPVKRDTPGGPTAKFEAVRTGRLPPATVHGMKVEAEKVELQILDDEAIERKAVEEENRRHQRDLRDHMPAWHTDSTVHVADKVTTPPANGKPNTHKPTATNDTPPTKQEEDAEDEVTTPQKEPKPGEPEDPEDPEDPNPSQPPTQDDPDDSKKPEADNDELKSYFAAVAEEDNEDSSAPESDSGEDSDEEESGSGSGSGGQGGGAGQPGDEGGKVDSPVDAAENEDGNADADADSEPPAKKVRRSSDSGASTGTGTPATATATATATGDGTAETEHADADADAVESSEGDESDG